ncbi:hypothetical protein BDY21DRAFT_416653 [Lineolata rhizophorae]|uniref:Uncharacterized protein n=1 Tax=Lineolata rhizophorae TaxID=578093 RepID=A0A6A6NSI8_9PEZI|nr:hypothetical protein BDY21DRAFT_416653 [Lineolata rhizophorae]
MAIQESVDFLGSASWIGADAYDPSGEFHERATAFLAAVNLRNSIPCYFDEKFSIGHFNMARRIVFADGISWVARRRLPPLNAGLGDREVLDAASSLKVEVASMSFLKFVALPEVYSYSVDPTNDVGAPYILMEYVNGTVATELREIKKCDTGLFGTPDQDREFRRQMANIHVTMSSFTFDQIGSLYQDEQTSEFVIGPDIETGKGPWTSSMEYYADLANHALQVCASSAPDEVLTSCSFTIPILFKHLMSLYGHNCSVGGSFSLANRDFGAHNLLVDEDFKIVGVIDLGGVMAAPIEAVAQYPVLTVLNREPPGHVETRPAAIDRIRRTEPRLKEYRDLVELAEARLGISKGNTAIASLMLSEATSVFQGLLRYGSYQKFVNDKWMDAYLKLLREHIRSSYNSC